MNPNSWLLPALLFVNLAILPYFVFLLAISLSAILFSSREQRRADDPSSKFLIVIPAHNEQTGIATTVRSCRAADYPSLLFGVIVIADNCTDQTAALAREAGARVCERSDDVKKSKGYAIEFLLESLGRSGQLDSLDAVVIVDADTTIDPNLLRSFDHALRRGHDWIQAYYTVANPDQSWRTRLMTYAFGMFNGVMQLGQNALGSSAGFKGNGMCFSTRGLRRRPWKSYGLVEDMEYSWTLRVAGEKILFVSDVAVYGAMLSAGGKDAANQRRRWEFGRGDIRKKYLGAVLGSNDLGWWEKVLSTGELTIPSMATLALVYLVVAGLDLSVWRMTAASTDSMMRACLVASAIVMTVGLCVYAISPFLAMRLPLRYLSTLFLFPFYVVWKLFISLAGKPRQWVRTAREPVQ
jgi:cellulose synthase/poly-beta-1,6-N-acetylglucosamine synthase-like glycosyltransferase